MLSFTSSSKSGKIPWKTPHRRLTVQESLSCKRKQSVWSSKQHQYLQLPKQLDSRLPLNSEQPVAPCCVEPTSCTAVFTIGELQWIAVVPWYIKRTFSHQGFLGCAQCLLRRALANACCISTAEIGQCRKKRGGVFQQTSEFTGDGLGVKRLRLSAFCALRCSTVIGQCKNDWKLFLANLPEATQQTQCSESWFLWCQKVLTLEATWCTAFHAAVPWSERGWIDLYPRTPHSSSDICGVPLLVSPHFWCENSKAFCILRPALIYAHWLVVAFNDWKHSLHICLKQCNTYNESCGVKRHWLQKQLDTQRFMLLSPEAGGVTSSDTLIFGFRHVRFLCWSHRILRPSILLSVPSIYFSFWNTHTLTHTDLHTHTHTHMPTPYTNDKPSKKGTSSKNLKSRQMSLTEKFNFSQWSAFKNARSALWFTIAVYCFKEKTTDYINSLIAWQNLNCITLVAIPQAIKIRHLPSIWTQDKQQQM